MRKTTYRIRFKHYGRVAFVETLSNFREACRAARKWACVREQVAEIQGADGSPLVEYRLDSSGRVRKS